MPEFHLSLMFMGEQRGGDKQVILVIKEMVSWMLAGTVVPRKSMGEYVARREVAFMKETGCDQIRVGVKSDRELASVDLVERVGKVRDSRGTQPMIIEVACSSAGNGFAERGAASVQGHVHGEGRSPWDTQSFHSWWSMRPFFLTVGSPA